MQMHISICINCHVLVSFPVTISLLLECTVIYVLFVYPVVVVVDDVVVSYLFTLLLHTVIMFLVLLLLFYCCLWLWLGRACDQVVCHLKYFFPNNGCGCYTILHDLNKWRLHDIKNNNN